jgi:hypothetical protein
VRFSTALQRLRGHLRIPRHCHRQPLSIVRRHIRLLRTG